MPVALAVLIAILMLFMLPILIPIAMVEDGIGNRRKRRIAQSTRCEACGSILGREALDLADAATEPAPWRDAAGQGMRVRYVRILHAICPACGARYRYEDRAFHHLPDAPATEEGAHAARPGAEGDGLL